MVLVEAIGSSVTPFVPLPFVDDMLFARLLRRIARKVLVRGGESPTDPLVAAIVDGYARANETGIGETAVVAAARFVMRKVAVVLDVKKSHDVFGEAIAFALALDIAREYGTVRERSAPAVGLAIARSLRAVGSGPIELLAEAAKASFTKSSSPGAFPGASPGASAAGDSSADAKPDPSRFARISEAVGQKVDEARMLLANVMRYELRNAGLM